VFAEAQLYLQATFGMMMKEWPAKEKVSVRERRGMFTFFLFALGENVIFQLS